jgi:UDP-2,3-diacylglucosamine hydrolase
MHAVRRAHTWIHGHTHRPAIHKLQIGEQAAKRIVLGDWDKSRLGVAGG